MTSHSIHHILVLVDSIQTQMSLTAVQNASRLTNTEYDLFSELGNSISTSVAEIEAQLGASNLSAADLAIRSRRAYQWLKFLSLPDNLSTHLGALKHLNQLLAERSFPKSLKKSRFQFSFYHQGALYQINSQPNSLLAKVQEGFITAPDMVLNALLDIPFSPPARESRALIKDYTFSREYQRIRQTLEYLEIPRDSYTSGNCRHLGDSFQRVNQVYFGSEMPRPNLVWNNRATFRKFGHYQWDTDTVMISSSLDNPKVPELVVDYVMYHELLHKKLGARKTKRQRIAHTRQFRFEENKFQGITKAKRLLNRVAHTQAQAKLR